MEHQTYACTWKQLKAGYRLSLKRNPRVTAFGKCFEEAEDDLHGLICSEYGDGESILEFDPPPPVKDKGLCLFDPALFVLDATDSVSQSSREDGLYSDAYCCCCGAGLGRRTKKKLTLAAVPKCDVSFVRKAKPQIWLFSQKVVEFLRHSGLPKGAFREVLFSVKSNRDFFELVAEPEIEFVGVKRPARPTDGWECARCRIKWFHPFHNAVASSIFNFLARADLKRVTGRAFVTGSSYEREIGLSANLAAKLRRISGLKGIVTSRIALLDNDEIDRNPKVKILKKGDFA